MNYGHNGRGNSLQRSSSQRGGYYGDPYCEAYYSFSRGYTQPMNYIPYNDSYGGSRSSYNNSGHGSSGLVGWGASAPAVVDEAMTLSVDVSNAKSVLIVGDGDLSFAASLVNHVLHVERITATVYEKEEEFLKRYGDQDHTSGLVNLKTLQGTSCNMLFGIDATDIRGSLRKCQQERGGVAPSVDVEKIQYDVVIFNFPYPIEWNSTNVRGRAEKLMRDFLPSAQKVISEKGQIRIALVNKQFEMWYIAQTLQNAKLEVERVEKFDKELFEHFRSRYGDDREQKKSGTKANYIDTGNPRYFIIRKKAFMDAQRRERLADTKQIVDAQQKVRDQQKAEREAEKKREEEEAARKKKDEQERKKAEEERIKQEEQEKLRARRRDLAKKAEEENNERKRREQQLRLAQQQLQLQHQQQHANEVSSGSISGGDNAPNGSAVNNKPKSAIKQTLLQNVKVEAKADVAGSALPAANKRTQVPPALQVDKLNTEHIAVFPAPRLRDVVLHPEGRAFTLVEVREKFEKLRSDSLFLYADGYFYTRERCRVALDFRVAQRVLKDQREKRKAKIQKQLQDQQAKQKVQPADRAGAHTSAQGILNTIDSVVDVLPPSSLEVQNPFASEGTPTSAETVPAGTAATKRAASTTQQHEVAVAGAPAIKRVRRDSTPSRLPHREVLGDAEMPQRGDRARQEVSLRNPFHDSDAMEVEEDFGAINKMTMPHREMRVEERPSVVPTAPHSSFEDGKPAAPKHVPLLHTTTTTSTTTTTVMMNKSSASSNHVVRSARSARKSLHEAENTQVMQTRELIASSVVAVAAPQRPADARVSGQGNKDPSSGKVRKVPLLNNNEQTPPTVPSERSDRNSTTSTRMNTRTVPVLPTPLSRGGQAPPPPPPERPAVAQALHADEDDNNKERELLLRRFYAKANQGKAATAAPKAHPPPSAVDNNTNAVRGPQRSGGGKASSSRGATAGGNRSNNALLRSVGPSGGVAPPPPPPPPPSDLLTSLLAGQRTIAHTNMMLNNLLSNPYDYAAPPLSAFPQMQTSTLLSEQRQPVSTDTRYAALQRAAHMSNPRRAW
ncbi:unnamed protein product [Amoebophrya sp. A25]|nr:unnamed protein product [Amoebophrya sp. A25]|eukprot:GSA25T00004413001.1